MSEKFVIVLNTVATSSCEEGHGLSKCLTKVRESDWNRVKDFVEKYKSHHKLECQMDYSCGAHGCVIYFDLQEIVEKAIIIPYNVENKELATIADVLDDNDFMNVIDEVIEELSNQMGLPPSDGEKDENVIDDDDEKDVSKIEIKESVMENKQVKIEVKQEIKEVKKETKEKQGQKRKISDLTSFDSDSEKKPRKKRTKIFKRAKTVAEMKNEPSFEISSSDEES